MALAPRGLDPGMIGMRRLWRPRILDPGMIGIRRPWRRAASIRA
jgi:hypothetical protein